MEALAENFFTSEQKNLIFENMSDGVLMIDEEGKISYLNSACAKILQVSAEEVKGTSFRETFLGNKKNLSFNRLFLSSLEKGQITEKTKVKYRNQDTVKQLSIDISLVQQENTMLRRKEAFQGMLVLIEDMTDNFRLKQHQHDCAYIFAGLIFCICLYLYTWSLLRFTLHLPVSTSDYTLMIEGITFALFLEIILFTSFSFREIGLIPDFSQFKKQFKETLIVGVIVSVAILLFKVILTLCGIRIKGYFIGGSLHGAATYLFTAFLQEFLARGVIQTSVKSIMRVRYQKQFGILLTSLLFSLMHLPFGFYFMAGALLLSLALGILYERHQNIWGCVLLHWGCGYLAMCLFF